MYTCDKEITKVISKLENELKDAKILDESAIALSIYLSVVHGVCGSSAYNGAGSRCCGYPSCYGDTASLFLWSLFVQHFLYVFGSEPVGNGL